VYCGTTVGFDFVLTLKKDYLLSIFIVYKLSSKLRKKQHLLQLYIVCTKWFFVLAEFIFLKTKNTKREF